MATATISQITEALSAAPGDWLEIETAAGVSRSIQKQNLLGALMSGGGTIATGGFTLTLLGNSTLNGSVVGNISGGGTLALGGFTLTVPATGTAVLKTGTPAVGTVASWTSANAIGAAAFTITGTGTLALGANTLTVAGASTINGSLVGNISGGGTLALGGFTLTVPATGTASLLGVAQTFSALETFGAGINLGQATNLTYFDMGVWPVAPTLGASGGAPTATYTQQDSYFMRVNTVVFFSFSLTINTISGGGGNIRIAMPFTASALAQPRVTAIIDGVAYPGTAPFVAAFNVLSSSNLAQIIVIQNNATFAALPVSLFGPGDSIQASGFYYV